MFDLFYSNFSKLQVYFDQYLTHYWPITNGGMLDQIGSAHMKQGALTSFTTDRFGNANSALALNSGWTQVPSGVYFNTPQFTISVWVYPQQVGYWSRVIDFGNGPNQDNVLMSLSNGNSLQPYIAISPPTGQLPAAISSQKLVMNQWQFLVTTFNGINFRVYLNGQLTASLDYSYTMKTLTRSNCFIGKSNYASDGVSSSFLDDLRFYNKSLTQTEIQQLMNQVCKKFFF